MEQVNYGGEYKLDIWILRAHGGAFGWGTALQAGRSRVPFPMVSFRLH
jgi:hypothetical protein